MIHHYTAQTHDATGTYRRVPGAGSHPSRAWLAAHGWYEVADPPPAPAPGMTWHGTGYRLQDGYSVPVGEWRETPPDPALAVRAGIAAGIRETFAALGIQIPPPDWTAAEAALSALPRTVDVLAAVVKIMALRTQLYEAGGTWESVA